MEEKKPIILWIHGFAGKPNNDNVQEMRRKFPKYEWFSIEVEHYARKSLDKINQFIKDNPNVAIVAGTSLGGYYAMCSDFSGPKLVVNPAVDPLNEMKQFIGMNTYKPGRPDGQTDFLFTEEMMNEFGTLPMQSLDKTYCQHTMHDSVLGEEAKEHYKRMFTYRDELPEKVLPDHFLTFSYVKKGMGIAIDFIEKNLM